MRLIRVHFQVLKSVILDSYFIYILSLLTAGICVFIFMIMEVLLTSPVPVLGYMDYRSILMAKPSGEGMMVRIMRSSYMMETQRYNLPITTITMYGPALIIMVR